VKLMSRLLIPGLAILSLSCVFVSTHVRSLDPNRLTAARPYANRLVPATTARIYSATKAHLIDGRMVVFPAGFLLQGRTMVGAGKCYDLTRADWASVGALALDSVACLEQYTREFQPLPTLAMAPVAGYWIFTGAVALFKMIFGSCPTVYAFDGEGYHLEAEEFSYSIAPKCEGNDLDRLDSGRVLGGEYRLKVTNEALETHYINQLRLVTADHPDRYQAFPTDRGDILLFGRATPISSARSRSGQDVLTQIANRDGHGFESDSAAVRALSRSPARDWIDISVARPARAAKLRLALRFRNTQLSTLMLYEMMLKSQGIKALDWTGIRGNDLAHVLRLRNWFTRNFGLHLKLKGTKGYREVARVLDTGPICWHETAVELAVPAADTIRLRLDFLPDYVVIDWVSASFDTGADCRVAELDCAEIECPDGMQPEPARAALSRVDRQYLITSPGQRYILKFRPPPVPEGMRRDYFVKSRGYYLEWLRRGWFEAPVASFEPGDSVIVAAARRWQVEKPDIERRFAEFRIPVREQEER